MPRSEPISERNLDGYGAPQIEWTRVRDVLDAEMTQAPDSGGPGRHTPWLTTINPDGRFHVMPLGVISSDGTWYFNSGPGTRKSRNITRDPRCVVSHCHTPLRSRGRRQRRAGHRGRRTATRSNGVRRTGLAGHRGGCRTDRRFQRPGRWAAAVARVQARPVEGVRARHCGALRCRPIRHRAVPQPHVSAKEKGYPR
jgi:Pyridoxamine 5'-phosphate oxidase